MTTPPDPQALLRSKSYLGLLILAALLGVPISAAAYGFLALVSYLQSELFTHLPNGLGFHGAPPWWPLPSWRGRPAGRPGHPVPAGHGRPFAGRRFQAGEGAPAPPQLPGVLLAALATLSLGVVLGPEAPLIALGGGLAVLAVRLARRDMPAQATAVVAAAGSFAADQHALRLAHRGRVPADGGLGPGRFDDGGGPAARPARLRRGCAHLRRPRLADRASARSPWRCRACRTSPGPTSPNSAGPW